MAFEHRKSGDCNFIDGGSLTCVYCNVERFKLGAEFNTLQVSRSFRFYLYIWIPLFIGPAPNASLISFSVPII